MGAGVSTVSTQIGTKEHFRIWLYQNRNGINYTQYCRLSVKEKLRVQADYMGRDEKQLQHAADISNPPKKEKI